MALQNNPTQAQVVAEVKRLESDKYDASNPSGFLSFAYTRIKDGAGTEYAASSTRNGVMFAGESGIEVVKQDVSGDSAAVMMRFRPASGYKLPTNTEWNAKADTSAIPTKTSQLTNDSGYLTSNLGAYPVGAVYISTSSTSPASLIGGSWQQLSDFQIPVGIAGTALPVRTGGRHSGTTTALNFDYISGNTSYQCNQTSAQNALISDGVSLTISQLNGSSWGSNWGGFGTIIPNNLYANIDSDRLLTLHAWQRTA